MYALVDCNILRSANVFFSRNSTEETGCDLSNMARHFQVMKRRRLGLWVHRHFKGIGKEKKCTIIFFTMRYMI
jgi:hypothetical protein